MFRLKVIYGMLFLYISSILFSIELKLVASPRIELGSGASETLILSPSDWRQPGGHCTKSSISFLGIFYQLQIKIFFSFNRFSLSLKLLAINKFKRNIGPD